MLNRWLRVRSAPLRSAPLPAGALSCSAPLRALALFTFGPHVPAGHSLRPACAASLPLRGKRSLFYFASLGAIAPPSVRQGTRV